MNASEPQLRAAVPAGPTNERTPASAGLVQSSALLAGGDPGEPEMLSTELHDNRQCRELILQLHDFENEVFGPDFACDRSHWQAWVDSGCLLQAAVSGEAVAGRRRIFSSLSVFITTAAARDRLLLGQIADYDLTPWTSAGPDEQPTLYLSSVVAVAPQHLAGMYRSLLGDALRFRDAHGLGFHGGFAIAAAPAGRRHMAKSGFRLLDGYKYRGAYDLMVIDAHTAASPFWIGLLHDDTAFLRRADASRSVAASTLPMAHPPGFGESDREVERRLAQAKADRLRRGLDY